MTTQTKTTVNCPYCGNGAELVTGKTVYPHRQDLWRKRFYVCQPCDARVGCHNQTNKPLGRLANAELRAMKIRAHNAFDPLWKSGELKRKDAYKWLAAMLGISKKQCHVGMFDVDMCQRVIDVCKRRNVTERLD